MQHATHYRCVYDCAQSAWEAVECLILEAVLELKIEPRAVSFSPEEEEDDRLQHCRSVRSTRKDKAGCWYSHNRTCLEVMVALANGKKGLSRCK